MTKEIEKIKQGLEDWFSIIDYRDKEQTAWCRRNITELKRELRERRKQLS